MIILHPDEGDDIASYKTVVVPHPLKPGQVAHMLAKGSDGEKCYYLGTNGCMIYGRRR